MEYLYAPWRGMYTKQEHQEKWSAPADGKSIFTRMFEQHAIQHDDAQFLILKRCAHTVVLLNLYPYNPGHLLVVPIRQIERLGELTKAERAEFMEVLCAATTLMEKTLENTGTNVGFNLGDWSSGGSIPEHLHAHIIPRWKGDTSFLPLLAETKPLSEDLKVVFAKLKPVFEQMMVE